MPHKDPEARRRYVNARYKAIQEGTHIVNKGGNPRKGENIHCDYCGKEFYRSPGNRLVNRGKFQYCSRECMAQAYEGRMVGEKSPRWKGNKTLPCSYCGALITRQIWEITLRNQEHLFCDRKCFASWKSENWNGAANPCWRGGHPPYYGDNWLRQAREARRRDGHVCQFCDVSENDLRRALNVHHIKPFRLFGIDNYKQANKLTNLISLCDKCHSYLEQFCKNGTVEDWPTLLQLGKVHLK